MQYWARKAELYSVEQWTRGRVMWENITSGQSGDCLVYLGLLIYILYGFVHGPWSVRCTSLIIDGIITYHPIGWCASWESVEWLWELSEMSGPILGHVLPTTGTLVLNQEWARDPFLIKAWAKCTSPTPFMDTHLSISRCICWFPFFWLVNTCTATGCWVCTQGV